MADLKTRLENLATRIATEIKSVRTLVNGNVAGLTALKTTAKTNLVAALNELHDEIDTLAASGGATINDGSTASGTQTYSITKIRDLIAAAKADIMGPDTQAALDTIKELAEAIGNDSNFAATVTTALGNRLRTDTATQNLTEQQKTNARTNLDVYSKAEIGNPDTDLVAVFVAGLAS